MTASLKDAWKNEYIQTAMIIVFIVLIFFGSWFGATAVLNTPNPIVVVPTGSMCVPYGYLCPGWNHPFDRTLHTGDLLVLQGLSPLDYNTNYPYSDIIVFHEPGNPNNLIVHRIVSVDNVNGTLFFRTKGDGNPTTRWPGIPSPSELDPWSRPGASGVSQDQVIGRVVLRSPWVGHLVLFMQSTFGIVVVVLVVLVLLVVEFLLPEIRKKPVPTSASSAEI